MMAPLAVVLAAVGEGLVLGVVLVVSLISWIFNLVQGNKPKAKPGNRPRPANQEQSELERFLKEVVGNKPAPEPEKKRPAPPPVPKPARMDGEKRNKPKQKPQAKTQAPPRPAASERPGARMAQTHLAQATVGDGVRSHVSSQMEARNIDAAVKRDVDGAVRRDIDDAVRRDLGAGATTTASQQPVHPMILALRNPEGVRQAVMMAEILSRPKSMR